ncbi:hypothetical protein [Sulfurovum sp.]|uniref:hypothetical protein n=1 Tax=Sulfurovum sp. TaxID=1969726 RepID=UPI0035687D4A
MEILTKDNVATWDLGGTVVVIEVQHLHQALFDKDNNVVVALSGQIKKPMLITIFSVEGNEICQISEPKDCYFNYIGKNRGHDVAVMGTVYMSGWLDWWFSINIQSGSLESLGEGR